MLAVPPHPLIDRLRGQISLVELCLRVFDARARESPRPEMKTPPTVKTNDGPGSESTKPLVLAIAKPVRSGPDARGNPAAARRRLQSPTRPLKFRAGYRLAWALLIVLTAASVMGPAFGQQTPRPTPVEAAAGVEPLAPPSDDPGARPREDAVPPHMGPKVAAPTEAEVGALTTIPGAWTPEGPGPISGGQVEGITNGFVCGAVHAVITHPTNANIVYIGAVNGGVWKTTNATAANPTWATTTDSFGSLSIGALAIDPSDATGNTVWAGIGRFSSWYRFGGSRSGLLKTTDGGANWSVVDGGGTLLGKNISGMVVRGNTILVSVNTGDVTSNPNLGVWRSTNGGTSFTQMAVGDGTGATGLPEGVAHDIVSSSSAPDTVYTCIAMPTTTAARGIYKSANLGATWSRVSTAAMHAYFTSVTSNIEMSVGNSSNLFIGILESGAPVAIFSTPDGGANWTKMDLPTMPVSSAVTRTVTGATNATPIVITTSVAHGYSTNNYIEIAGVTGNTAANGIHQITVLTTTTFSLDFSVGNGAYVSGGTARFVTSPSPRGAKGPEEGPPEEIAGGQGSIHFSILADPSNASLVYLGGDRQDVPFTNYIGANNYSGNLWRGSTALAPNGLSPSSQWKHLTHSNAIAGIPGGGTSNNSSPHADSRDMAMDVNGSLIEVDDGGVFRRSNPQSNTGAWTSMAGNLQVTEAHSVAYDTVSNIIMTGNQDNGTSVQNSSGSVAYTAVSTADGGDVAVSVNPANASQSIRYSSFQNLAAGSFRKRIMSNTNVLVSQSFPALSPLSGAPALTGQFTTPVEVNVINANRLIIGASNGVYESTDQGATVSRVSTLSPNDGGSGGRTVVYGGRQSGSPNAEVIYFADSSAVYRRVTAGVTPAAVAGYTGSTVRGIVADPEDYDHLFAIDNNQVFRSTDGGVSFTDITGDIPSVAKDFRSLEFIRAGTEWAIVVGTLRGVYAARYNAVSDWGPVGTDLPNVYVWDMDFDAADGVLIVSTLGRGVWRFSNAQDIAIAPAPEIVVEEPVGNGLTSGVGTRNFGQVAPGGTAVLTFKITNIGTANLTNLIVSMSGTHLNDFTPGSLGMTTLIPAASTTFTVTFAPSAPGLRSGAIHIESDDADENPFNVALLGTGLTSQEAWRQQYFGSTANAGNAADDFDANANGIKNLLEYALGGDPIGASTGLGVLPQVDVNLSGKLEIAFVRYVNRNDITLSVEAASAVGGSWTTLARSTGGNPFVVLEAGASVTDPGTGNARAVTVTDLYLVDDPAHPKRFMRMQVTSP